MDSIFESSATLLVLRLFLLRPTERFYVNQLARMQHISQSSASLCCKALAKKRILLHEKAGNALFYRLNTENTFSRQLCKAAIAEEIIESGAIAAILEEDPFVISIAVYGSFAKASFDKKSDLDILIVSSAGKEFSKAASLLEKKFKKEASLTILSPDEWGKLLKKNDTFFFSVLSDHTLLHGSSLAVL